MSVRLAARAEHLWRSLAVKYWLTMLLLFVVWATTYGAKLEIYPPPKPPPQPPAASY